MDKQLKFYYVNMKYIRNLAKNDDKVFSVSPQIGKQDRPFVGILLMINGKQYCAPLSSPKPKHKTMADSCDFLKITKKNGNKEEIIGVINFNNMIPVHQSVIREVDLKITSKDAPQTKGHKELMGKQLNWCRSNSDLIIKSAQKTYSMVTNGNENKKLIRRCCKFKNLERVLDKWIQNEQQKNQSQTKNIQNTSTKRKSLDSRLNSLHKNDKSTQNQAKKPPHKKPHRKHDTLE